MPTAIALAANRNREDSVFYPMARKVLSPAEMEPLLGELRRVDDKLGADCFARNEDRVAKMDALLREGL